MNVSKVTQFELALLLRSLSIVKTKPNGTIAFFFRTLMKFLQSCPKGSLSALWVKIKNSESASAESAVSLVDIPKNDDPNNPSAGSHFSIIDQLPELQYLKDSLHTEVRHDPLLFVRALYDSAMGDIVHSNNVDRCILLTTGMLLGMKSERISLILHSLIVFHLLKDDVELIRDPVLVEFISSTFPQNSNNADTNKNSDAADSSNDLSDKDFGWENVFALTPLADLTHIRSVLLETQADTSRRQSCHVLSCGKADHGKLKHFYCRIFRLYHFLCDYHRQIGFGRYSIESIDTNTSRFVGTRRYNENRLNEHVLFGFIQIYRSCIFVGNRRDSWSCGDCIARGFFASASSVFTASCKNPGHFVWIGPCLVFGSSRQSV